MSTQKDLTDSLNNILLFLIDTKLCFTKQIPNVSDKQIKILFAKISNSRQLMITDLKKILKLQGKELLHKGKNISKAHEVFENITKVLTNEDSSIITNEIRRSENVLIDYYKNALTLDLSETNRDILLKHLERIQDDLNQADFISVTAD